MTLCYRNADVISNGERMKVKWCANALLYSFSQAENNMYALSRVQAFAGYWNVILEGPEHHNCGHPWEGY